MPAPHQLSAEVPHPWQTHHHGCSLQGSARSRWNVSEPNPLPDLNTEPHSTTMCCSSASKPQCSVADCCRMNSKHPSRLVLEIPAGPLSHMRAAAASGATLSTQQPIHQRTVAEFTCKRDIYWWPWHSSIHTRCDPAVQTLKGRVPC